MDLELICRRLKYAEIGTYIFYLALFSWNRYWILLFPTMVPVFYNLHGVRTCIIEQVPYKEIKNMLFYLAGWGCLNLIIIFIVIF